MIGERWCNHRRRETVVLEMAGLALGLLAAFITYHGNVEGDLGGSLRRMLSVVAPIAVGLYALHQPLYQRFGRLLCLCGVMWFLASLGTATDPLIYSIGRVAGWFAELLLLYVVLAFPTGRLPGRPERRLALAGLALVMLFYVPSILLVGHFPVPSPATLCTADCPANAFSVLGHEPSWVENVLRPLREGLTVLLIVAVVARLGWRVVHASRLMHRTLMPVLVIAILRLVVLALALSVRALDGQSALGSTLSEMLLAGVVVIAGTFLLGLLSWRIYVAETLQRFASSVNAHLDTAGLRDAVARALGDPSVEIVLPGPGGWVDASRERVRPPAPGSGRMLTEVRDGQRRVAAIIHDDVLAEQQPFVEAVAAYATLSLDNERLNRRVRSTAHALADSRGRIAAAADDERRRIARDLHDGAQQRLVALRIRLELTKELVDRDPHAAAEELERLSYETAEALDDVRSLAAGVYPPLLADHGLAEAVRASARHSPVPARIDVAGIGRYSRQVESAVYFCCLEAMQNAAKHASRASELTVSLRDADGLRFEIRDDGPGFDTAACEGGGAGLISMRDRVEAVGGSITVDSQPGIGTRVAGRIPPEALLAGHEAHVTPGTVAAPPQPALAHSSNGHG